MGKHYMPQADVALEQWATRVARAFTGEPGRFGLTGALATGVLAAAEAYAEALRVARDPVTRTSIAVGRKNVARAAVKAQVRAAVAVMRGAVAAGQVPEQVVADLGLPTARPGGYRRATPAPAVAPRVSAADASDAFARRVRVTTWDEPADAEAATPAGGTEVFVVAVDRAGDPPAALSAWTYGGRTRRGRAVVTMPADAPPGAWLWVSARHVSPTGEPGPLAAPQRVRVPFAMNDAA